MPLHCFVRCTIAAASDSLFTRAITLMDAHYTTLLHDAGKGGEEMMMMMMESGSVHESYLPKAGPYEEQKTIIRVEELLSGTVSDDRIAQADTICMTGGSVDDNVAECIASKVLPKANALRTINLASTQMSSLGLLRVLKAAVHQIPCSSLEGLLLRDVHLHPEECAVIGQVIVRQRSRLKQLQLQRCHMDDAAGQAIAEAIARTVSLREVRLADNDMVPAFAFPVNEALAFPKSLRLLDLSGNRIVPAHHRGLHRAIRHCAALISELYLARCSLTEGGLRALLDAGIHHSQSLRVLDLTSCCLLRTAGRVVCSILTESPNLQRLYLQDNLIEADGAARISVGLEYAKNLAVLGMGKCHLGGRGTRLIASAVKHSPSLRELDLSENNVQDVDVEYICAKSGSATVRLNLLNLSGNPLTERSRLAIQKILGVQRGSLCTVLVRGTSIIEGGVSYLQCGDLYPF